MFGIDVWHMSFKTHRMASMEKSMHGIWMSIVTSSLPLRSLVWYSSMPW